MAAVLGGRRGGDLAALSDVGDVADREHERDRERGDRLLSVTAQGPRGRKEYALTDAGLAELRHWLLDTEPEVHPRSEALLRVFLLGAVSRDQAREYLAWIAKRSAEDTAALEALGATIGWDDDDLSRYGRLEGLNTVSACPR